MSGAIEGTHVEDFLNPKSMPTPAAAAAIVALIAGALFKNFGLSVAFCTISLSFLIGLIVFQSREFKSNSSSKLTKIVLYLVNSLIIFAMATGTTSVMAEEIIDQKRPLFYDWTKTEPEFLQKYPEPTNPYYELKVEVLKKEDGGIKGWLQEKGVLTKDYQTRIVLVPKSGQESLQVKGVDIVFPENEFDNKKIKLSPDQLSNGVNIKAWKSFLVDAEITTESGEKINLYKYVNPQDPANTYIQPDKMHE